MLSHSEGQGLGVVGDVDLSCRNHVLGEDKGYIVDSESIKLEGDLYVRQGKMKKVRVYFGIAWLKASFLK